MDDRDELREIIREEIGRREEATTRGEINTFVWCGHCGAAEWGVPPHGLRNPCPLTIERWEYERAQKEKTDAVYIEKLEAEAKFFQSGGTIGQQLRAVFRK